MTSGAHSYLFVSWRLTHGPKPVERCNLCGRPKFQKHAETCSGRLQRIAEPVLRIFEDCGCPPGYMHLPTCYLVTGDEAA